MAKDLYGVRWTCSRSFAVEQALCLIPTVQFVQTNSYFESFFLLILQTSDFCVLQTLDFVFDPSLLGCLLCSGSNIHLPRSSGC